MHENKIKISRIPNGNICSPEGFKASGITANIKQSGDLDIALIYSEYPAATSGVFTANLFTAAPVKYCQKILKENSFSQAIFINSGNANACTGQQGLSDAEETALKAASALQLEPEQVLVASTGRIGVNLPMDKINAGIEKAVSALSPKEGNTAARAIMTTDTRSKEIAISLIIDNKKITVAGMAKGAGMIAPKLKGLHATMLAFITTDANVSPTFLNSLLPQIADQSFNRISVDGDMSTNDSLFIMANGKAGNSIIESGSNNAELFALAVKKVACYLAKEIVRDGEGITKCITLQIRNAATNQDAKLCAEAIANSLLCKTAWFGNDPNWGRIVAAAGYSGAKFDPDKVSVFYEHLPVFLKGCDAKTSEKDVARLLKNNSFTLIVDLAAGEYSYQMWTNDISYKYVEINADYHT